jgi:hypothetical protein
MDMALKHDTQLGQAWLRRLRGEGPPPTDFGLAVAFVLAGIQRFEQSVLDALKVGHGWQEGKFEGRAPCAGHGRECVGDSFCSVLLQGLVLRSYRDAAMLAECPWLPGGGQQRSVASSAKAALLEEALLRCARDSKHGEGAIVQPMVMLAASLMQAGGPMASAGTAASSAKGIGTLHSAVGSVAASRAAELGIEVLVELFAVHREFRRDIIAVAQDRLVGAKVCCVRAHVYKCRFGGLGFTSCPLRVLIVNSLDPIMFSSTQPMACCLTG